MYLLTISSFIFVISQGLFAHGLSLDFDFTRNPVVDVPGVGKILGSVQKTYLTKRDINVFLGIPYGKIPQRFAPSVEADRLTEDNGIFNATQPQFPCIQPPNPSVPNSENSGVEDCLTLSIYTPKTFSFKPLPVIVFVHGGSFFRWSGNMWNGRRLLERDVIFVSINYRLGPLGFFSLGIDDAPGNLGLYDIITSLQWVKKNIRSFGGDPNKVTLSGQSAGAASVTWLLESPLAKGLFRNAIAMSGADVDAWANQQAPISNSLAGANALGCLIYQPNTTTPDNAAILKCLRNLPAPAFSAALTAFYSAPSVQTYELTIPKVAPTDPLTSLQQGLQLPVPLIIGATKNDGSFLASRLYSGLHVNGLDTNPAFLKYQLIPFILSSYGLKDNPPGSFNNLARKYLGDTLDSGNFTLMTPGLIDLYSVLYFKQGSFTIASYHCLVNPNTYLYSFDYYGTSTYYPYTGGVPEVPRGVTHVDDLMYISQNTDYTKVEDYFVSLQMVDAWANFATTSDPNKRFEGEIPIFNAWPKWNEKTHEFVKINIYPTKDNDYQAYWVGASNNIQG